MSSVLHPVGPERRGVYWRRRLLAVLVLLAVVVLAVLGVRALTSERAAGEPAAQQIDPSQVSSTLTAQPTDGPSASPTGSPSATATTSAAVAPCEGAALGVVLTSDATTYGPGRTPKFALTVQNVSPVTCSVEVGSGMRTFVATDASGAQVWSSEDCQSSTASQVYDVEPQASKSMTSTWSRQRSAAGCPDGQEMVPDGTYTVTGTWNGVAAAPVTVSFSG
ncbi:hypothetical protein GTQ99_15725 [Kineococcus sp. T13]|uniref:hypothetical protein n=1 Tax=Kineococcus vitellinus TaxID=2696565 RepID=UPI00141299EB|nr:hypothetical protein [Kineococcus vitellinus]NAZ76857.1 hypothetical protein [Kineococcus vitellinus]